MSDLKAELEHALRRRGFDDGYAGHEKAFPKEKSYLDSYQHGVDAHNSDLARLQRGREGGQKGRAAQAEGSGSRPPAHNKKGVR